MEKKFKFSDKNAVSKIVYLTVISILCVSAIVIGIVASNSRKKTEIPEVPDTSDGSDNSGESNGDNAPSGDVTEDEKPAVTELVFVSPVAGTVIKSHSTTTPVFSNTLDEWRIHTGLDISAEDGAEVSASAEGEVTRVYNDPMLGATVEITHSATHKSYYSNLDKDTIKCKVGDKVSGGQLIGYIGDTTVSELADEPHLHFELKVGGASVNPLDYISDQSKLSSLGIVSGSES